MLLRKIFITLSLLLLSLACGFSQSTGELFETYFSLLEKYSNYRERGDHRYNLSYDQDLRKLNRSAHRLPTNDPAKEYLQVMIFKEQVRVLVFDYEAFPDLYDWCNDARITLLQNATGTLKAIADRATSGDWLWQRFQAPRYNRRELTAFRLYPLNKPAFLERVWEEVYQYQTVGLIKRAEDLVYQHTVPGKTFKQLEFFLDHARYKDLGRNERMLYNANADAAFVELFKSLNQSGELVSLAAFRERYGKKSDASLWNALLDKYQKMITDTETAATKVSRILTNPSATPDQLIQIVEEHGEKEVAFLALQRLYALHLTDSPNQAFQPVLNRIAANFRGDNLAKIERFGQLVAPAYQDGLNLYPQVVPGSVEHPLPFAITLTPDQEKLGISIPGGETNYYLTEDLTKPYDQGVLGSARFLSYNFATNNERLANDLKEFDVRRLISSADLPDGSIEDIFVYWPRKIMFFVSNSSRGKLEGINEDERTCGTTEYAVPHLITPLGLNSQNEHFHGRNNGNGSFDIYYCSFDAVNKVWSRPRLLLGKLFSPNSEFAERSPVVSEDGNTLYFASEGFAGKGKFDIYAVNISIATNGSVSVTSAPQNISSVNTPADELFFFPRTQANYLVSNRDSDGYYRLYKCSSAPPAPLKLENVPTPVLTPEGQQADRTTVIKLSDNLSLVMDCVTLDKPNNDFPGLVPVVGYVYDRRGRRVPNARLVFSNSADEQQVGTIGLNTVDTFYRVDLHEKQTYSAQIFAYGADGRKIEAYASGIVFTCERGIDTKNVTVRHFMVKDLDYYPILSEIDTNILITEAPFFFATNRWALFEEGVQRDHIITPHYALLRDSIINNLSQHLLLIGFADERGNVADNCLLSKNRCTAVKEFLVRLGIPQNHIHILPLGETTSFGEESYAEYVQMLLLENQNLSNTQAIWQLNRRVGVAILPNGMIDTIWKPCN